MSKIKESKLIIGKKYLRRNSDEIVTLLCFGSQRVLIVDDKTKHESSISIDDFLEIFNIYKKPPIKLTPHLGCGGEIVYLSAFFKYPDFYNKKWVQSKGGFRPIPGIPGILIDQETFEIIGLAEL